MSVNKSGDTATITITDKNGTTTAQISDGAAGAAGQDGQPGSDGQDGITPIVTVTSITGGHNVAFDYGTGNSKNTDFDIMDGATGSQGPKGDTGATGPKGDKGDTGEDGYSPVASVSKSGTVTTITITDKVGTTTAQVNDGVKGDTGEEGPKGDTGDSGVYIGETAPTDPDVSVWIDTSGTRDLAPTVEISSITGGHNVAFNYGTGDSRNRNFDVMDGVIPIKGTDYWTQADQTAIVNDVLLATLPIGEGVSF